MAKSTTTRPTTARAKPAAQKPVAKKPGAKKAVPAKRPEARRKDPLTEAKRWLRDHALVFPESTEEFPWGEAVYKVRGKVFVFTGTDADVFSLTVKLPRSREFAIDQSLAEPSGYGLGKSGWVTATFDRGGEIPFDYLEAWIRESYLAVAPKRLAQTLLA